MQRLAFAGRWPLLGCQWPSLLLRHQRAEGDTANARTQAIDKLAPSGRVQGAMSGAGEKGVFMALRMAF